MSTRNLRIGQLELENFIRRLKNEAKTSRDGEAVEAISALRLAMLWSYRHGVSAFSILRFTCPRLGYSCPQDGGTVFRTVGKTRCAEEIEDLAFEVLGMTETQSVEKREEQWNAIRQDYRRATATN